MSKINELAIGDSTVNEKIVKEYGTFKLQDKDITENGKHYADVGFNGMRLANVNVSGGSGSLPTRWYLWKCTYRGRETLQYLPFNVAPQTLSEDDNYTFGFNINDYMQGINEISSIVSNVANYQKGDTDTSFFVDAHLGHKYELVDGTPYYISDSEPIAYAWVSTGIVYFTNFDEALTSEEFNSSKILSILVQDNSIIRTEIIRGSSWLEDGDTYTRIDDNSFSISWSDGGSNTYTRDSSKDFTLWSE